MTITSESLVAPAPMDHVIADWAVTSLQFGIDTRRSAVPRDAALAKRRTCDSPHRAPEQVSTPARSRPQSGRTGQEGGLIEGESLGEGGIRFDFKSNVLAFRGPAQPSPALGDALNADYLSRGEAPRLRTHRISSAKAALCSLRGG